MILSNNHNDMDLGMLLREKLPVNQLATVKIADYNIIS